MSSRCPKSTKCRYNFENKIEASLEKQNQDLKKSQFNKYFFPSNSRVFIESDISFLASSSSYFVNVVNCCFSMIALLKMEKYFLEIRTEMLMDAYTHTY